MPLYNYRCNDCLVVASQTKGATLTDDEEWEVIFETSHAMSPTDAEVNEACICPRCNGRNVEKTMRGSRIIGYIRGNGYLDRAGVHRDMNLCKLRNDDPYAEMRQPGEADDLAARLRRAGQHDSKPKHFVMTETKSLEQAVTKAVTTPE